MHMYKDILRMQKTHMYTDKHTCIHIQEVQFYVDVQYNMQINVEVFGLKED